MGIITSTANSSPLFAADISGFDDAEYYVGDYFAYHFDEAIYDILSGNGDVYSISNSYLHA